VRNLRFIFNPRSGNNAKNPCLFERVRSFIRDHAPDARLVFTERPRHATELARQAVDDGCNVVVAIGGDGTLNEVAVALIDTPAALGLIPCGSGNGLCRHLGIFGSGRDVFRTLLEGEIRAIDTGLADGHPFINAMGVGFDAEIAHRFNQLERRGLSSYVKTTAAVLLSHRGETCEISNGTTSFQASAFIVCVANSDQYGNDCFIAPGAAVDDGQLNLTVIKRVNLLNALPVAARLFLKKIDGSVHFDRLSGARFTIRRSMPGLLHTDGEIHRAAALIEVIVRPRSLRITWPLKSGKTKW
jgi:YegS/Rv2252/BmrU family lipid kinase